MNKTPMQIMSEMQKTFEERGKIYGDNYKRVGKVLDAMFPDGVVLKGEEQFNRWHLFEMIVMKVTRLAVTNLEHQDSIHDIGVYAPMLESLFSEDKLHQRCNATFNCERCTRADTPHTMHEGKTGMLWPAVTYEER